MPAAPARCADGVKTVVNKITWQKAGRVTKPGRYMFTFGWLTVSAEDLAIWERFPRASFTLVQMHSGSADEPFEFHLGAFEISNESSDSGS